MNAADIQNTLRGCPGAEHIAWLLAAWAPGAAPLQPDSVTAHYILDARGPSAADIVARAQERAAGDQAVAEVTGWRISTFSDIIVTFRAPNERLYDLVTRLDPTSGALAFARATRTAHGIDINVKSVSDLNEDEWRAINAVFMAAFNNANDTYLRGRLKSLGPISMGWKDGRVLGFCAVGTVKAELPFIGARTFTDVGLTCIHPDARNLGLSNAIGAFATSVRSDDGPVDFAVAHFATPITLHASLGLSRGAWPGNTIAEVAAAMAEPTPCQKAVGQALADLAGAKSYDADHWILRSGVYHGEPNAIPEGLAPEYSQLFRPADPTQGDSLLLVKWWKEPPPVWWR